MEFEGVKVFSASMAREREGIGDRVTGWLAENPDIKVVDKIVTQSSDNSYHCITITLFYRREEVVDNKVRGKRRKVA